MRRTRCWGLKASVWTSSESVPYSRSWIVDKFPGSLWAYESKRFRNRGHRRGSPKDKPRDSMQLDQSRRFDDVCECLNRVIEIGGILKKG